MNDAIFYFFYNFTHQSILLDKLFVFFAVYFPFIVILLAGLFLIFYRKSLREFCLVFFSSGITVVIALILKKLIHTDRPFIALQNVQSLFSESGFAFPSGHTAFFSALAFSTFFLSSSTTVTAGRSKKAGYYFIFFALLIGLARIVTGVHFPIDILGGFALGFIVSYGVKFFYDKFAYSPENV